MPRRRIILPAIAAFLLAAVAASGAAACSCRHMSPEEYARWVDVLVEGEVVSAEIKDGRQTTVLRITNILKGDVRVGRYPGQTILVATTTSPASCGYRFPVQGRVTAALRAGKGGYSTGLCTMLPLTTMDADRYLNAVRASVPR